MLAKVKNVFRKVGKSKNTGDAVTIFRIGSCRVFSIENTASDNFFFTNTPIGYTHTPCEAIQLVQYLRGQKQIPPHLLKYIYTFYGGDQYDTNIDEIFAKNQVSLEKADMFLVELCSLKILKYLDFNFQISRFNDSHKWNIEAPGSDIVDATQSTVYSFEMFDAEISELAALLNGKPIIFTGHINIETNEGRYIKERQIINEWIEKICQRDGYYYYDLSSDIDKDKERYIQPDLIHFKKPLYKLANQRINDIVSRQMGLTD